MNELEAKSVPTQTAAPLSLSAVTPTNPETAADPALALLATSTLIGEYVLLGGEGGGPASGARLVIMLLLPGHETYAAFKTKPVLAEAALVGMNVFGDRDIDGAGYKVAEVSVAS